MSRIFTWGTITYIFLFLCLTQVADALIPGQLDVTTYAVVAVRATAVEGIDQVCTGAPMQAWGTVTFIDVILATLSCKARLTFAVIAFSKAHTGGMVHTRVTSTVVYLHLAVTASVAHLTDTHVVVVFNQT